MTLLPQIVLVFIALPGCHCVVEGTLIDTPEGARPVESLSIGDEVWTCAPGGVRDIGSIRAIESHHAEAYLEIAFAHGSQLRVTAAHPISVPGGTKVARQIQRGDFVLSAKGPLRVVEVTRKRGPVRVYDLSVSPTPYYFANGILVHNKSIVLPPQPEDLVGIWSGFTECDLDYFRLSLQRDQTGLCAHVFVREQALLYKVTRWSLQGYDLAIELLPVDEAAEQIYMKGTTDGHTLRLEIGGKQLHWSRKLKMRREGELDHISRLAKERMQAAGK